jgi:hypothetical protein
MMTMPGPDERFAIVPIPPGPSSDVPLSDAIVVGNLSEVFEYIGQTPAREAAENNLAEAQAHAAKVEQLQAMARSCNILAFADSINHLNSRLDAFVARRDARVRRDAEEAEREEAARIQAMLDSLTDPDDPAPLQSVDHHPTGDLHDLPPKQEPQSQADGTDNVGDLPAELSDPLEPDT